MTASQGDLVAYAKPPVEEVVLGVQFPPIPHFSDAHAGLYWQRVRANYPRAESQLRLEGPINHLDHLSQFDSSCQSVANLRAVPGLLELRTSI